MRRKCPYCDSENIREEDDKSIVLFYMNNGVKIYAKKYVCKDCGWDWSDHKKLWRR